MKKYLQFLMFSGIVAVFMLIPNKANCLYGSYYVKATATGTGDGSSWTNAFTDLQHAIDVAQPGDIICVAAGTYLPTFRHDGDSLRHSTFYIDSDITLLGGFSGEPGTEGSMEGRDPVVHATILSGDLGLSGDTSDNAFHVVFIDHVSDTMHLDGFIITDGNNFGAEGFGTYGAGIFLDAEAGRCSPVIANCVIRDNHADQGGAGIMIYAGSTGVSFATFSNCKILRNVAGGGGGIQGLVDGEGILNPAIVNCYLQGNVARTAQGSAISLIVHSATSVVQMINTVVTGNHATTSSAFDIFLTGTGLAQPNIINSVFAGNNNGSLRVSSIGTVNSLITVRNSIFWGNGFGHGLTTNNATADVSYSIFQFGIDGTNNLSADPLFVHQPSATSTPHTDGDVHLQPGSPAIEAGDNGAVPALINIDADGLPRFIDSNTGLAGGIVDIGAFEYQQAITSITPIFKTMDWNVFPNPSISNISITMPRNDSNTHLSIWNTNGESVYSEDSDAGMNTQHVNVSGLAPGMYVVTVTAGGYTDYRKIVVEN